MKAVSQNERFLKEAIVFGNTQFIGKMNSPMQGCAQITTIPHIIEFVRNLIETENNSRIVPNLLRMIDFIQRRINDNQDPSSAIEMLKRYFKHDEAFVEILFNTIVKLAAHKNTFFGPGKMNWFGRTNKTSSIEILERELSQIPTRHKIPLDRIALDSQMLISPHPPTMQPSPFALALQAGLTSPSSLLKSQPYDDSCAHLSMTQELKKKLPAWLAYPEFETDLASALLIYNTDGRHVDDENKKYFFNGVFAGQRCKIARAGRCQISFNRKENSWEVFIVSDHETINGAYKYIRRNSVLMHYSLTEEKVTSVERDVSPSQKSPAFFQRKYSQKDWEGDGFRSFVKIGKNGPYISYLSPYLGADLLEYLHEKKDLLSVAEKHPLGKMFLKEVFTQLRAQNGKVFDIKIENTLVEIDPVADAPLKINIIDSHTFAATESHYPEHLQNEMSKYRHCPDLFARAVKSLNTRYLEIILTFTGIVSFSNPCEKFSEENLKLMLQLIGEIEMEYQSQHRQGTPTLRPLVDRDRIHYVWKKLIQNPAEGEGLLANQVVHRSQQLKRHHAT